MNATSVAVTSTLLARRNCRRSTAAAAAAAAVIDVDSAARQTPRCFVVLWYAAVVGTSQYLSYDASESEVHLHLRYQPSRNA